MHYINSLPLPLILLPILSYFCQSNSHMNVQYNDNHGDYPADDGDHMNSEYKWKWVPIHLQTVEFW